jgi:methionine sulfoxide reductase heme-binding subunit
VNTLLSGKVSPGHRRWRLRLLNHHLPLAFTALLAVVLLYRGFPRPDAIWKLSMATAYVSLFLLVLTLVIGPFRILQRRRMPLSQDLRRDTGIWAGILGLFHTAVGLNVHLRGRPWLYFIYQKRESHFFPLRHDQFGLANETGLFAAGLLALLLATSNDWSLRYFGTPGWKRLQRWSYGLFALTVAHGILYQVIEKRTTTFVATFLVLALMAITLQALGFFLRRHNDRSKALHQPNEGAPTCLP